MKQSILIISNIDDSHLAFVTKHLTSPFTIVDPADCINGTELSYECADGRFRVRFGDQVLEEIKSVWYRKPTPVWGQDLPVSAQYAKYTETALRTHIQELYAQFPDALWVSHYHAIREADNKSRQLLAAAELGFRIPETLTTSSASRAMNFVRDHPSTIVKSPASSFPLNTKGDPTMFYSHLIGPDSKFDYSGLELAPAIFQEAIPDPLDIRVTVVGEELFAASVHTKENAETSHLRDWRQEVFFDNIKLQVHALPPDVQERCIGLVKKLSLSFGAIDLLLDTEGNYWFLEINPNGQWAFVEQLTQQPIGKALARLLEAGLERTETHR